ncbi:MAG TPA: peptidoglycan DD-metalloendopeptidase family protein [Pedobacter sp.]
MAVTPLEELRIWLDDHQISPVVDFDPAADQLCPFDFTAGNTELTSDIVDDTGVFSEWTAGKLAVSGARYGVGGYNEHRTIYNRSSHFDTGEEPRRLHLGIDIWAEAGTPVYNFYDAEVHSFQYNDSFGDYGATVILKYNLDGMVLYALYGHLSLSSLRGLQEGQFIPGGARFAEFGNRQENGNWPPHLHFQLMFDMQQRKGDYPGVCQFSKRAEFLANCPDPSLVLEHTFQVSAK